MSAQEHGACCGGTEGVRSEAACANLPPLLESPRARYSDRLPLTRSLSMEAETTRHSAGFTRNDVLRQRRPFRATCHYMFIHPGLTRPIYMHEKHIYLCTHSSVQINRQHFFISGLLKPRDNISHFNPYLQK